MKLKIIESFRILYDYTSKIFHEMIDVEGTSCVSNELIEIYSVKEDKEKYLEAIKTNKPQKIKLSSGKTIYINHH